MHEISGVTRDGGYATHMIAHVSAVAHVPDDLDVVESAPLLCAGVTTFNALRHTGAGPGDVVAVHGVGGLGHLGIQFAARQGFRTVAVNRGRDKEELAKKLGASDYIDSGAGGPGQGADRDGRRESDPRHRHRRQSDAGDLWRAWPERGDDGDRRRRPIDRRIPSICSPSAPRSKAGIRGSPGIPRTRWNSAQRNNVASMNEIYPLEKAQEAYDRMLSGKARFRVVLKMDG